MTGPVSTQVCAAWATEADLPDDHPELAPGRWDELLLVATEIMWALSGRRWSGRGTPPCSASATLRMQQSSMAGWWPAGMDAIRGAGFGHDYIARPSVQAQRVVKLPHDETTLVTAVTIGGEPFAAWHHRGAWLYRDDGAGWQECDGQDVVVHYEWGQLPPVGGTRAMLLLAIELGKSEIGDSSCRLPKRVVNVTRQGISMALLDPQTFLTRGKLGMPDIDQWLASVNPKGYAERGSFWTPDVLRAESS